MKFNFFLLLLLTWVTLLMSSCQEGITSKELDNSSELSHLKNYVYLSDSMENRAIEVYKCLKVYNSIPIKKPLLRYELNLKKDTLLDIIVYLYDHKIRFNQIQNNEPNVEIRIELNQNDVYNLEFVHSFNGMAIEELSLKDDKIHRIKINDTTSLVHFNEYKRNGELLEFGSYAVDGKEVNDTLVQITNSSILEAMLFDSIELINKKRKTDQSID